MHAARGSARRLATLGCALALFAAPLRPASAHASAAQAEVSVGMPARISDLVLPGPELEPTPAKDATPLVLHLLAVRPHGTAFRYDLEYWGLEPGSYDLRDFLRHKDGTPLDLSAAGLPPIPVTVRSVFPAGQVRPHPPGERAAPSFGGYRALLIAAGALWVVGLIAILLAGRKRKALEAERARPRTLAEQLQPLVERALAGELSRGERAQLELTLLAYWRRKLGLEERRPHEVLALLREHPQAGPLLASLERWLHAPARTVEVVDVAALLAPYRDLPPEEPSDADDSTRLETAVARDARRAGAARAH